MTELNMEQTSVTQESKGFYKLNWLQRIGFGSATWRKTSSTDHLHVSVVLLHRHLWT